MEVAARAFVAGLRLPESPPRPSDAGPRPRVVGVMIASVDGRATVDGRSVGLGHPDDRALLRELRAGVDAVLVGSRTLVAERYATLLDDDQREHRRATGLTEHPVIATISRDGSLGPGDVPLFGEPGVPITVYSEDTALVVSADAAADVRSVALGGVRVPRVLADLREHHGARCVACEGGPGLLRQLAAAGCLDELLITIAPLLVAGDGPAPTTGEPLPGPPRLTLRDVHRADDHLFLHYVSP